MGIEKLGDILLLEHLATGGMAEIFRAKQYGLNGFEKVVAVKRVLPHNATSKEFQDMFMAESNLSALLQHPNIAHVFSNGHQNGFYYLVMEYVDGKNLRQLQVKAEEKKTKIPLPLFCYVICETLKGLDFAHNFVDDKTGEPLNIVHRDVNHQNIMVGYEGAVKIVDFGVAKVNDMDRQKTKAGVLKGKISYMSPEQVRGRKVDRRTDLFSLGIVMWELLAERNLFMAEDELGTLERIRDCIVPSFSEIGVEVPAELERIVRKALEKDPANRYLNAKELLADLQKFLNENYPAYFQSDVSAFLKELFKEEITEERMRKEKLNIEAKAFLARNPILRPGNTKIFGQVDAQRKDKVAGAASIGLEDNQDKTIISSEVESIAKAAETLSGSKSVPGWAQSSGAIQNSRFEYDLSNTSVYSSAINTHSTKLIVFLLFIAVGGVYMWFKERERLLFASYESSKTEVWSRSFRANFVESCSMQEIVPKGLDGIKFCECLAKPVEQAQILYTKYNPNVITEEAHAQVNLGEFRKFMNSAAGDYARGKCLSAVASDE